MKVISLWAKNNPKKTWFLITLLHFTLVYLAFLLSDLLVQNNYYFPSFIFTLSFLAFFVVLIIHPRKGKYFFRKFCDFVLTLLGFVQVCFLFNSEDTPFKSSEILFASTIIPNSQGYKYPASQKIIEDFKKDHHKISKKESRILLRELKYQSRKLATHEKAGGNDKTLEIIAIILLAIAIFLGVAFLACGISCGGAETLAILVLIGGLGLSIFVAWFFIRNINKKKRADAAPITQN